MLEKLIKLAHAMPLKVVGKHLLIKPITVQYPEERLTVPERFRGLHLYDPEKCMGCGACAKICPNKCIEILLSITPDGKKKIEEYNIYLGRCMFCGLCEDYCPGRGVIKLVSGYESVGKERRPLVYNIPLLRK